MAVFGCLLSLHKNIKREGMETPAAAAAAYRTPTYLSPPDLTPTPIQLATLKLVSASGCDRPPHHPVDFGTLSSLQSFYCTPGTMSSLR